MSDRVLALRQRTKDNDSRESGDQSTSHVNAVTAPMRARQRILTAFLLLTTALLAWWLYAAGRTMVETFGLTARSACGGLYLCVLFLMIPWVEIRLIFNRWIPTPRQFFAALAIGICAGELQLVADESAFRVEAQAMDQPCSRNRWWPSQNAQLLYDPQSGFWATD